MENKNRIPELFGSMVFNENTMKERLPKQIYKDLKKAIANNMTLDLGVANIVANAMKDWALEKGVTHFTHWFQPMTGITAEKHDAFISPTNDGEILMEFSGKELIQGEPDASSFPSGGLRATFEARGYTAWDPSSPAFIKDNVLCIPTVFYSYTGEALDKKTPLLRSMEALNIQALRVLKLFGRDEVSRVSTTVGPEQEYFLIDKKYYDQRLDLMLTGRTLLGAMPPKGQEMDDHYFGNIKTRIAVYMEDLDRELWKVGILAKTKHNEVAPAQHELAPIFNLSNVSTDHNQLTMELMKKVAERHGLVCLLHEKPFEGINGSGKHNNWSLSTNLGENLLEPGKNPEENLQFVTFLCAVIKAVDDYQDLLRISVANAGNDHRLGANEAPPAIVSMYLGAHLNEVLAAIENGSNYSSKKEERMELGVDIIPKFAKDTSDRNRTSPFAFTGNKFEFRMLGSTFSISCCNVMLNTSVAESLCQFADELEGKEDFKTSLNGLLKRTIKENKKIIFNGNGYAEEWVVEAEKRGLLNLKTTVDALPHYIKEKNLSLFEKHHIYTKNEIHSRYEILLEEYSKVINIEGLTTVEMVRRQLLPAITSFMKELSDTIISKKAVGLSTSCDMERGILTQVSTLANKLYEEVEKLNTLIGKGVDYADAYENANFFKEQIIPVMEATRLAADSLEGLVGQSYWPLPSYSDLIYRI